jgi:TM2 domain-containing membrane protein YozV
MKYCIHCGKENRDEARFCGHCGQTFLNAPLGQKEPLESEGRVPRSVLSAFLSSVVPGLGQIYNRQFYKGIVFIIIALIYGALSISSKLISSNLTSLYLPFVVYNIVDAWYGGKGRGRRAPRGG